MVVSHLISIVGAGPGDPDLLAVLAQKRIKAADVILYDALLGEDILQLAKSGAEKIYVGKLYKDGQNQKHRQNEIHSCFLEFAKQNKKVIRLKAGDAMIFGRGAEEIRFCKNNNLNYEVIPGITAGIAASSLFQIPLTERGKNGMALLYTGKRKDGTFSDLNSVVNILGSGSPVIIYMGLNNLPDLSRGLQNENIGGHLPVQMVSKVSQAGQKIYSTTLSGISEFLEKNQPETPCIIIIGENAESI